MKPAPFEYRAPASVEEALPLLEEDAAVLAGGQSLVPLLNLRLARPALVVDINGIAELDYLHADDGALRIGAMTRQVTLERSELVARRWPLLAKAVRHVGHHQIRTRGTVGGSVAHADPAAELPAALMALEARLHLRSTAGARSVEASEFFLGPLYTAREPDELLVEIEVAGWSGGTGFAEFARTHGDFATAGAAAVISPGGEARVALFGAGPAPVRAKAAEGALADGAGAREAAALAAQDVDDEHRRALCTELARRAIEEARA